MDISGEINVLAELERCGITYDWSGEEEVRTLCPFHEDDGKAHEPSCCVNVKTKVFKCHVAGCDAEGSILKYLARKFDCTQAVIVAELSKRYNFEQEKLVDTDVIEQWHDRIWKAGPLLAELRKRGITDDDIRERRLGESDGRITIPVANKSGYYVNVRKYLPGAPGRDKMRNLKGRGQPRWYPVDQLRFDTVMICGGEMKAIAAARQLNPHGVGAICGTSERRELEQDLLPDIKGKSIIVCMDVDRAGQVASNGIAAQVFRFAESVSILTLPLDRDKHPKGDINDFVVEGGDLYALLPEAVPWAPAYAATTDEEPTDVALIDAVHARQTGKRMRVRGIVTAVADAPYSVPREVRVMCDRSQKECALCPVYTSQSDLATIHPESPAILEMIDTSRVRLRDALMNGVGVPRTCRVVDFEPISYYNAEDARISPQLEITSRSADRLMQPAICVGDRLELNESYDLTGRMYPHPASQQATLLISGYKPTQDALSTYECTDLERLDMFQPKDWTPAGLQAKLDELYEDFENNVTRVWQRRDLHLIVDLAYHSPLFITFDDRTEKGWVEVLVVSDSSQGKSSVAVGPTGNGGLCKHYGLGEKVECKNASVAGLIGGLQQISGKWFVTWGALPTHDKRLVILEELKGASTEVIAKLTDMRSSGIAEIPKIERRRTRARCRIIAMSNPRSERDIATYNFGIEAVRELIGSPEDVRRFDLAHVMARGEVDASALNVLQRSRPHTPHVHTGDLCRSLVLWAWTREPQQALFDRECTSLVLDRATTLCNEFTDAIPLVDRGSTRLKLARLSASLAARTFSCDESRTKIVVRPCHVDYMYEFIKRIYGSPTMGYKDFTAACNIAVTLLDPEVIKKQVASLPYPRDFIKSILHTNNIEQQDVQDWCGWDRTEAAQLVSFLVRKHALIRHGRYYHKTPLFIQLLKELLEDKSLKDRPAFIKGEY